MRSGRSRTPHPPASARRKYTVRVGDRKITLERGKSLIGRAKDCAVCLNEELVSRRHAWFVVDDEGLHIEDLGSANGTFVNQARLHGRVTLFPGDQVFVGMREIEVLREEGGDERQSRPVIEIEARGIRAPQASGTDLSPSLRQDARPEPRASVPRMEGVRPPDTTTEVDAFEYLSRLADKMFTMGRVAAAQKILASNLREILTHAERGGALAPELVDAAGAAAIKLAAETREGRWVDMAVELHFLAVRPFREPTIRSLAVLRAKARIGDDGLLGRYYRRLVNEASLGPAERLLVERIASLLPDDENR